MTNSKMIKTKNTDMDWEIQTILLITLNLYDEKYFITEWKEIFVESKKKPLRFQTISQVMSRKPSYSDPYRKSRVTMLNRDTYFVSLIMETPEGKRIGISRMSKNWKPKKLQNTPSTHILNHRHEMKKYIEIEPEKTKRTLCPKHNIENKKQNIHLHSQSSYRPQRYEIRRDHF